MAEGEKTVTPDDPAVAGAKKDAAAAEIARKKAEADAAAAAKKG